MIEVDMTDLLQIEDMMIGNDILLYMFHLIWVHGCVQWEYERERNEFILMIETETETGVTEKEKMIDTQGESPQETLQTILLLVMITIMIIIRNQQKSKPKNPVNF